MTSIGWTDVSGETVGSHVYTFPAQKTQGTAPLPSGELLARLFCHHMISALPDEAVFELTEDLNDLGLRYLKPREELRQLTQAPSRVKAKMGSSVRRAEIEVDGE